MVHHSSFLKKTNVIHSQRYDVDRKQKASREEPFPTERIQKGVNFRCENGAASAEADKTKIFKEVGDKRETLDQKVVCMS